MSNFQHRDDLLEVRHLDGVPNFAQAHRRAKGAKGAGIRYEERVQAQFKRTFGPLYIPSPWFQYRTKHSTRLWNYAQPDGILLDFVKGRVTIVEMKFSHTAEAYFQLVDKYLPLMQKFLGTELWTFATCEVVQWYDKAVSFPCEVRLRKEIQLTEPNEFGVHICRPS